MDNFMTEKEAASKECCRIKVGAFSLEDLENSTCNEDDMNCVGSKCMAWQWATQEKGFCGLVGDPRIILQLQNLNDQIHDIKLDINEIANRSL